MSAAEQWAKQILWLLHHKGKDRRVINRAEQSLGLSAGYLRKRRDAGTIDLEKCMRLIEAFGVHPARFFRQAFPVGESDDISQLVDPARGTPPDIVRRAYARLDQNTPSTIDEQHLIRLDTLRYADPERAAQGAEDAIDFVAVHHVPVTLGIWASAQRLLVSFDHAQHAITAGLTIADQLQLPRATADLIRRLSYVTADRDAYPIALALAKEATDRYLCIGDLPSVGRTLIDRGVWLYYLERYDDAIAVDERALALLPDDDIRHHVAALQVLGLCHKNHGDLARAEHLVTRARALSAPLEPLFHGKLLWLEASIKAEQDRYADCEALLRDVVALFRPIHRGEAALAAVDLADVLVVQERYADALLVASDILPLIARLASRNHLIRAAETALINIIRVGHRSISPADIARARKALKRVERERHLWRSLRCG